MVTNYKKQYRIVIIEPSTIVANGLKNLIDTSREFEISAIVTDHSNPLEHVNQLEPDIVIINPALIDSKRRQHQENLFSGFKSRAFVALVYQYVEAEFLKQFHAIIDISDNTEKIISKLQQALELISHPQEQSDKNDLSEREKDVLIALAKGKINKEIADMYNISVHTVITHRKNIIRKTGIKSVSGLTVYAILNNLIDINDVE